MKKVFCLITVMKALCVGVGRPLMSGQPLIKIHWKSDGLSKHMINQHHRVIWAPDPVFLS